VKRRNSVQPRAIVLQQERPSDNAVWLIIVAISLWGLLTATVNF